MTDKDTTTTTTAAAALRAEIGSYEAIKSALADASRLIEAGDVRAADQLIRSTPGITQCDIWANLSPPAINSLRLYARRTAAIRGKAG